MAVYSEFGETIKEEITEELYLWLLYSIEFSSEELEFTRKPTKIEKEISDYLTSNGITSVAMILDRLGKNSKEEILAGLLSLYEEGKIVGKETQ